MLQVATCKENKKKKAEENIGNICANQRYCGNIVVLFVAANDEKVLKSATTQRTLAGAGKHIINAGPN